MNRLIRILLVFTGGTIGSEGGDGGWLHPSDSERQAQTILRLARSYINSSRVELIPVQPLNLLSEVIHPTDWAKICVSSLEHAKFSGVDGVLILHGTDTLSYSAAAVSFYEPLSKRWPVVLSGSNKPMAAEGSDGPLNVGQSLAALEYFIDKGIKGAFVVFNGTFGSDDDGKIFLASRVKKFTWAGHCFRNFNLGERSWVGNVNGCGVRMEDDVMRRIPTDIVFPDIKPVFDCRAMEYHAIHPGMNPELLLRASENSYVRAVLLALYNSGTGPTQGLGSIREALRELKSKGKLVFAVSQHEGLGGMTMDIYETSAALRDDGVISLSDMMMESAIPKLMLALGNNSTANKVIEFMLTNIAYEIHQ